MLVTFNITYEILDISQEGNTALSMLGWYCTESFSQALLMT